MLTTESILLAIFTPLFPITPKLNNTNCTFQLLQNLKWDVRAEYPAAHMPRGDSLYEKVDCLFENLT